MGEYKTTIIGTIILALFYILFMLYDIEPFEEFISLLNSLEHYEIDEFVMPTICIFIFVLIDKVVSYKKNTYRNEKIQVYQEEIKETSHLLNDFLCQVQIFQFEAKKSKDFDKETFKRFKNLIDDIESKMDELNNKIDN